MATTYESTTSPPHVVAWTRAAHLDRYIDISGEVMDATAIVALAQSLDARADAALAQATRQVAILRAHAWAADARQAFSVAIDRLQEAGRLDALEDARCYGELPAALETIGAVAREGAAACEASR